MERLRLPLCARRFGALLLVLLLAVPVLAADEEAAEPAAPALPVAEALVAGPVPLVLPAFADAEKAGVKADGLFDALPILPQRESPRAGDAFAGPDGELAWRKTGRLQWEAAEGERLARWIVFYIDSDRWQKATLNVAGDHPVSAALDGQKLSLAAKAADEDAAEGAPKMQTAELTLPRGTHLVALRTMNDPEQEAAWKLEISVAPGEHADSGSLVVTTDPSRPLGIDLVLDAPRISNLELSPDGEQVAIALGEYRNGQDEDGWIELRETRGGRLLQLWRGQENPARLGWLPDGRKLGWQTSHEGKTTIWVHDLDTGRVEAVLEDVEHLGAWRWAPDGASLFYEISRSPDPDPRKVKRVLNPADRQPWWRGRSHLMQLFLPGGYSRQITAGPLSPDGWRISPDGRRLLFFTSEPDLTQRPFADSRLWLMDLATLETELVVDGDG